MKRFFETLVILAVALPATVGTQILAAEAAHASVRTATSVHPMQHRSGTNAAHPRALCTPRVEYNFTTTGTPQGGATQWITSCNLQQRVHERCWSQLDNKITPYNGGWVYSTTIASGQNCHRLGEELVRFGWQYRVGPGSPEHTSWIWIRPGFAPITTTAVLRPLITRATGPFWIKALSAPVCLKVSPNAVGTLFTQGNYNAGDCRKLFFTREGFVNGHPFGEYQTSTPVHDLAAGSTCSSVLLASPGATGTVWVQYQANPVDLYFINRHCNGILGGGTNCVAALSMDGTVGHDVFVEHLGASGWLQRIHQIQKSSAIRTSRAGC